MVKKKKKTKLEKAKDKCLIDNDPDSEDFSSCIRKELKKKVKNNQKKKSNNPFKMWGSYIGGVIGFISYLIFVSLTFGLLVSEIFGAIFFQPMGFFGILPSVILYGLIIVGFLIGWGIQMLIRRFRK